MQRGSLTKSGWSANLALPDHGRVARQNEAARAADASACIDTSLGAAPLKNGWRRR